MDLICGHWHAPAPCQPSLLFIRAAALCFLFYYLMWMTLTAMCHTFKCLNGITFFWWPIPKIGDISPVQRYYLQFRDISISVTVHPYGIPISGIE